MPTGQELTVERRAKSNTRAASAEETYRLFHLYAPILNKQQLPRTTAWMTRTSSQVKAESLSGLITL